MAGTTRTAATRLGRHVEVWRQQSEAGLRWIEDSATELPAGDPDDDQVCLTLARLLLTHTELSESLAAPTAQRPTSIADVAAVTFTGREVDLRREVADHADRHVLLAELRVVIDDIGDQLSVPDLPTVVRGWRTAVSLADLLRLSVVEWMLTLQTLQATNPGLPPAPQVPGAGADATRVLTQILAERNPGRSVELRVPPFAAVQIGLATDPGSTHTRGTPPNVVETDPASFLALAVGSIGFGELRRSGRLHASGAHSDLSGLFPLR